MPNKANVNKKMGYDELQNHLINKRGGHIHRNKKKTILRKQKYRGAKNG